MQTRECSVANLGAESVEALKAHLPSDENPLACFETQIEREGDYKATEFYIGLITPRRLVGVTVHLPKGFFGGYTGKNDIRAASMSLRDIVQIREGTWGNDGYYIDVVGHGDTTIRMLFNTRQFLLKYTGKLNEVIEQARSITSQSQISPADRLRELQNLYNERLISDAEYQQKRREILGQL
jgi:hypothetical protein